MWLRPVQWHMSKAIYNKRQKADRGIGRPHGSHAKNRRSSSPGILEPKLTASGLAWEQTFALCPLASQLARTANGFSLFACFLFRRLFEVTAKFHFTEDAFALHLFLERLQRLIDIIVANQNLHAFFPVCNAPRPIRSIKWTLIEVRSRQWSSRLPENTQSTLIQSKRTVHSLVYRNLIAADASLTLDGYIPEQSGRVHQVRE